MTETAVAGAALRLRDLTKTYGDYTAVDRVCLDVAPGEFVTLLGPSGSGKTTTLNMIAGFTDATSGEIMMDGEPIARLKPHRRNIGVVFQHYALFPHMTVGSNIAFALRQRKIPRSAANRRVQDALALVRLEGMAERYPRQLSGGQQQRVALARAVVFGPRILLMDEPLGALDKKLRESLQVEIRRIHREVGISVVYVTHDQEEALALSDRIAVFNGGRVEQIGGAKELYERPGTLFVAEFLGESNRVSGVYHRDPMASRLTRASMALPAPTHPHLNHGSPAVLVIRPEHVHVGTPPERSDAAAEALAGEVSEILYLGGTRRVEVRLANDLTLVARQQAGTWKPIAVGDRVALTYDPKQAVLLPSDTERDHAAT
jgi:putative spermidine/putrescine transport system ATP-binding protein